MPFASLLSRLRRTLPALLVTLVVARPLRAEPPPAPVAAKAPVSFLTLDDARAAIVDDSADPYFAKLTPAEMTAKTGRPITGDMPDAQRAECKARYQAACLEFTDDEQKAIAALVDRLHPAIERTYPKFAKQPWSFLKVKRTLEAGMPHTRGPHIVLPETIVPMLVQLSTAGDVGTRQAAGLLVHEQTHVVERAHPEWFAKLFTDVYGFRKAKRIEPDAWVDARRVVNPDGADASWVFPIKDEADGATRWIWPQIVFSNLETPSLRGMEMVAIDLEPVKAEGGAAPDTFKVKLDANGEPARVALQTVDRYVRAVRTRGNLYHPNEATADLLAALVIADALAQPAAAGGDDPLAPVRAWAKVTLGDARPK